MSGGKGIGVSVGPGCSHENVCVMGPLEGAQERRGKGAQRPEACLQVQDLTTDPGAWRALASEKNPQEHLGPQERWKGEQGSLESQSVGQGPLELGRCKGLVGGPPERGGVPETWMESGESGGEAELEVVAIVSLVTRDTEHCGYNPGGRALRVTGYLGAQRS